MVIIKPSLKNKDKLSARKYLAWVNDLLKLNLKSIEDLKSGKEYCQILLLGFPGSIDRTRVNKNPSNNLRLLIKGVKDLKAVDPINLTDVTDLTKAAKGGYKENYRLIFFMHELYTLNKTKILKSSS